MDVTEGANHGDSRQGDDSDRKCDSRFSVIVQGITRASMPPDGVLTSIPPRISEEVLTVSVDSSISSTPREESTGDSTCAQVMQESANSSDDYQCQSNW